MDYNQFLESKKHTSNNFGIQPNFIPEKMFDFQKYVTQYLILKGRGAGFLDTGMGKSFVELAIAQNYIQSTNKPVLIICPLAVAFQFLGEAEKFQIDDISYSKEGRYKTKIVLCNYERLHYFDPNDFDCVIGDESAILKNAEGFTSNFVTSFLKKVKYRYLFTATPSPNDFIELGTHSEALGYLGYTDMLGKFFTNNEDTISPMKIGTEWVLKGHAVEAFFKFISSFSISARKPSDLKDPSTGIPFDDSKYILPELITNMHSVKNEKNMVINGQILMFNNQARTRTEIAQENKLTIERRCEKAVELASKHERSVYWCNLNPEGELLSKLDKNSYEITGTMDIDKKEEILLGFLKGDIKKLVTKAKMNAWGMNWQHCDHTVFFPTWSYEQYYQAIRRFWRFGQPNKVTADLVYSDGQKRVLDGLIMKANKANELFSKLNLNLNSEYEIKSTEYNKPIILPKFF